MTSLPSDLRGGVVACRECGKTLLWINAVHMPYGGYAHKRCLDKFEAIRTVENLIEGTQNDSET